MKSQLHTGTESKPARRNGSQPPTGNDWAQAEFQQPGEQSPRLTAEQVIFTAEEHLEVQQQIEQRAHELWCAEGCRRDTALHYWLQAEHEVLGQFIRAYARRQALCQSSRPGASAVVVRKKPEPRILEPRRTIAATEPKTNSAFG